MAKKKTSVREFEVGQLFDEALSDKSAMVRMDTLESVAYDVKEEGYTKLLSEKEVTEYRADLSDVCIKINDIEEEKKVIVAGYTEQLKEPKADRAELLSSIKHKSEFRRGNLYYLDDQENGFMYIFDVNGECVESRPLKPTEKQTKMKAITSKTGTDGE